jgi:hypothetical protein
LAFYKAVSTGKKVLRKKEGFRDREVVYDQILSNGDFLHGDEVFIREA